MTEPKTVSLNTGERKMVATVVDMTIGKKPIHGVGKVCVNTTKEIGTGLHLNMISGTIVSETPLSNSGNSFDLLECDIYIVPRNRKEAAFPEMSLDELQIRLCMAED